MKGLKNILFAGIILAAGCSKPESKGQNEVHARINTLIKQMTLDEKIGQMIQQNTGQGNDSLVKAGMLGSILNEVDVNEINRLQGIAVTESRLKIPLLFGRDVIHGFKTIMPIPLAQGASWNLPLVEEGAKIAAIEARSVGINWTFSPMIDVARDPRWGRIAEGYGEDTYLTTQMGLATIKGYQGTQLTNPNSIAACAKHFVAYGAAEAGRDYHTVTLPENELRDVYLPPFKAAADAGVATFMVAFNEINGVPASGNEWLTRQILRHEWAYNGMVVSDWSSVSQLVVHGTAENNEVAAKIAANAGVEMDMASNCYAQYLKQLVEKGDVPLWVIDSAVYHILDVKMRLGLFENPYTNPNNFPEILNDDHKKVAKELAQESVVLLKNNHHCLPISNNIKSVAIIGPLANAPHDQLGTWIFDGHKSSSTTPLQAITNYLGADKVHYAPGLEISRTLTTEGFAKAIEAARKSEVILLFLGEESILSGESHCRADITLPGAQTALIEALSKTGKPIIGVVMAGRPLTFEKEAEKMEAIVYAWHGGSMAGPAISDIIFGKASPSGKLPVTFPRTVGQIPVYYAQKNSGKPATDATWEKMYDIPVEAFQLSVGNTNHYIDYGFKPWFPFGFGLSYTTFEYRNTRVEKGVYSATDTLTFRTTLVNTGNVEGSEVAQLYIRDLVGTRTRPVKQLKAFEKTKLNAGDSVEIVFNVPASALGFYNLNMEYVVESGEFKAGIGGSSETPLDLNFSIK